MDFERWLKYRVYQFAREKFEILFVSRSYIVEFHREKNPSFLLSLEHTRVIYFYIQNKSQVKSLLSG